MKNKALLATLLTAVVVPAIKSILNKNKKKKKKKKKTVDWRSVL